MLNCVESDFSRDNPIDFLIAAGVFEAVFVVFVVDVIVAVLGLLLVVAVVDVAAVAVDVAAVVVVVVAVAVVAVVVVVVVLVAVLGAAVAAEDLDLVMKISFLSIEIHVDAEFLVFVLEKVAPVVAVHKIVVSYSLNQTHVKRCDVDLDVS